MPVRPLSAGGGWVMENSCTDTTEAEDLYDFEDYEDCWNCGGDGMDPMSDYTLPCPFCWEGCDQ